MKTNLKTMLCVTVAVILTAGFASCGKDEPNNGGGSNNFTYNEHSYVIVKEKKNWQAAMEDARARGGYLVEIGGEDEQAAVWNAVKAAVSATYTQVPDGGGVAYVWLGALDFYGEGEWIWNGDNESGDMPVFWIGGKNGTAIDYANWGEGEPDNFTDSSVSPNGQDFAAIALEAWPQGSGSLGKAGQWNDLAGTDLLYYVVEFDKK
ncbi:MAG: hypothetical protein LBB41_01840 [Prevotellaceae bacterium]|jgi:hypothetical protein|nr:hypothetical protein [Prevotellaceae bacterium]